MEDSMALRPMFQQQANWIGVIAATLLAFYPSLTLAQIAGNGTLGTQVNGVAIAPCTKLVPSTAAPNAVSTFIIALKNFLFLQVDKPSLTTRRKFKTSSLALQAMPFLVSMV
jgi:hypothetical protein